MHTMCCLLAVSLAPDKLSIKLDLTSPFVLAPNKGQAMFSTVEQVLGESRGANAFVSEMALSSSIPTGLYL